MTTISACIMAKNEQDMLPKCLDSIKDWVDEIILVDTGSTDRTIDIAKQYGAKVYSHPWQNDFSLHRNQTIEYATGEWVFIIDCDEIVESDMTQFKKRLPMVRPEVSALVVTVKEIDQGQPRTSWLGLRFFRKSSGIHYKYAVHNKAVFDGMCGFTDIVMHHFGYSLDPEAMKRKRARTEGLLLKRIDDDPSDPLPYYYMCQIRIGEKNYDDAEKWGLKFFQNITIAPKELQHTSVMYYFMSWIYLNKGDGGNSAAWALKGLEFYPNDLDLNYIMARLGWQSENDEWLNKYSGIYFELLPDARARGEIDTHKFESVLNPDDWYNRTTYTACEAAEKDMRNFLEGASDDQG